jgi:putative flippase GtrA
MAWEMVRPLLQWWLVPRRLQRMLGAGLGGAVGSSADIAVLIALVESGVRVAGAAFAGAAAGAVVCFVVNKRWAFRDRTPVTLRQVASFAAVAAITATLMAVAMHLAVEDAGVPYLVAKALCAAAVFVVWSYPAQRRLVFVARRADLDLESARSLA